MSNYAKDIRKQVRNVVKEVLPEVLTQELLEALEKRLSAQLEFQVRALGENLKRTLEQIDERAKDVQNFMIRQVSAPLSVSTAALKPQSSDSQQS